MLMRTMVAGWLLLALAGCGGGSGTVDFGSNDGRVIVALGDSIVQGVEGGGAPWPARLAGLSGKTVINAGVGGEESGGALNRCASLLATHRPGYLLILTGANDAIMGSSTAAAVENIRAMVQTAKANGSVPVVATLLPMIGEHGIFDGAARRISAGLRTLADAEGVALVDLQSEFGEGAGLLIGDGLHPNDAGNQLIALAFNDAL